MYLLMILLVFFPVAAAFLSYLLGRNTKSGRDAFVGVVVIAEFLLAVALLLSHREGAVVTLPGISMPVISVQL